MGSQAHFRQSVLEKKMIKQLCVKVVLSQQVLSCDASNSFPIML